MTTTDRPRTALDSDRTKRWIDTKARGIHHVFRIRFLCPRCRTPWYQDITEEPEVFKAQGVPDRRNLGRAMLCGTCDSLSRMILGSVSAETETMYVLSADDVFDALAPLWKEPGLTWVSVEGMGVYSGNPATLKDDKKEAALLVNFVESTPGRWRRRASVTMSEAWALGWISGDRQEPKTAGSNKRRMR